MPVQIDPIFYGKDAQEILSKEVIDGLEEDGELDVL